MKKNGIELFGIVAFKDCEAANIRLYDECKSMNTVMIFAIPYKTDNTPSDTMNVSEYARVYDYHLYFGNLFTSLIKDLEAEFPSHIFKGFADHSPINEKKAAATAGIGVIGKSTLLITEKYGSFVFLGSVITDLETETEKHEIKSCIDCGRCIASCPGGALNKYGFDSEKCISALTQKKSLTDEDEIKIKANKAAWGCDVCQKICPMNENKLTTKIGYFIDSYLENVSSETIGNMSNEEFAKYPFSWRKKDVILRNLTLAENCGK